jgi:hypothetical protein
MREIKFRAWHPNEKVMHCFDWKTPDDVLSVGRLYSFRDLEIMQFTGLKDKNGKEIYEGDIVEAVETLHDVGVGERGKVVWANCGFTAQNIPPFDWDPMSPCFKLDTVALKVIGNICENPELLEGK